MYNLLILLTLLPSILSWASEGHQLTGKIALQLLTTHAKSFVDTFLPESHGPDLAIAAVKSKQLTTRHTLMGSSFRIHGHGIKNVSNESRLHYVQAWPTEDEPEVCGYESGRDCANGRCLVATIQNYTRMLECDFGASDEEKGMAISFLAHYVGDLAQPLHVCKRKNGGNGARASFNPRTKVYTLLTDHAT
jgi:hypothetical protein